jgi:hypothetical protein
MTCREFTERVTEYLEGRAPFRRRLALETHLGRCKHCREYLRQTKTTIRALRRLPEEAMPAAARDELMARFRSELPPALGSSAVSPSLRLLAAMEKSFGGERGWAIAGLILFGALLVSLISHLEAGPIGEGSRCLLMELGAGILPVSALALFAWSNRSSMSPGTLVTAGMTGGLVAFVMLQATCSMAHVAGHVLAFHLGGVIVVGLMALGVSRLPALR